MAGIGFALRRLTERDDLLGIVQGYAHSALVSSGPWLFTILAIGGINYFGLEKMGLGELAVFRVVMIYNFCFSLIVSGPVLLVGTRYLSDLIYSKKGDGAPGFLLAGLAALFALHALFVIPFYWFFVDLGVGERLAAVINYFLLVGIWFTSIFLTALQVYGAISGIFFLGMALTLGAGVLLGERWGAVGTLAGFDLGLALIMFALVARVFLEYPYPAVRPFAFLGHFRKYWDLGLVGLFSYLAAWSDKLVMWFAPEREMPVGGMVYHPAYDGAMFLAYLTTVPAMAIFVVNIETSFFARYQDFYADIQGHAVYKRIRNNHVRILKRLIESSRNISVLQLCVAILAILLSPALFDLMGFNILSIGIFRFGVMGALFQVLLLFVTIVLSYFDLRRQLLLIQVLYLVSNAGLTWLTMELGFPYYGLGYLLSSILTLVVAYAICAFELSRLPYLAFIKNNSSVD